MLGARFGVVPDGMCAHLAWVPSNLFGHLDMMLYCHRSQPRFAEIQTKVATMLKRVGFKKECVQYIPVSGFSGENLVEGIAATSGSWFDGPTLLNHIGGFAWCSNGLLPRMCMPCLFSAILDDPCPIFDGLRACLLAARLRALQSRSLCVGCGVCLGLP